MIDPDEISVMNKMLYVIMAIAMVVVALDLLVWRP